MMPPSLVAEKKYYLIMYQFAWNIYNLRLIRIFISSKCACKTKKNHLARGCFLSYNLRRWLVSRWV